tara:strand:+ start:681 stop:968 length:288 start_codon:yes stop_codon:yes gene_type:complete
MRNVSIIKTISDSITFYDGGETDFEYTLTLSSDGHQTNIDVKINTEHNELDEQCYNTGKTLRENLVGMILESEIDIDLINPIKYNVYDKRISNIR